MSDLDAALENQNKNEECVIPENMNTDFAEAVNRLDEMKIEEDLEILEVTKNDEDHEEDVSDTQSQGAQSSSSEVAEDKGSVCSGQEGLRTVLNQRAHPKRNHL